MKLKEQLNLMFRKSKVIKINVFMPDRRFKTYVRELDGLNNGETIECEGCTYVVKYDLIYFGGGIANLNYLYDNAMPYDMNENKVEQTELTGVQMTTILNNTIFKNLINEMKNKDKEIKNMIVLVGGLTLLVMLAGFYFLYDQIVILQEYNETNLPILQSIWEFIRNGEFN